jgi:hypothetical protein
VTFLATDLYPGGNVFLFLATFDLAPALLVMLSTICELIDVMGIFEAGFAVGDGSFFLGEAASACLGIEGGTFAWILGGTVGEPVALEGGGSVVFGGFGCGLELVGDRFKLLVESSGGVLFFVGSSCTAFRIFEVSGVTEALDVVFAGELGEGCATFEVCCICGFEGLF